MAIHTLTAEQMQKFISAVGSIPRSIAGNQFSTEELRKIAGSHGGLRDWPKITDDPKVNYAVDCVVNDYPGAEEPTYDEQLYADEIEAYRAQDTFV